MIYKKEAHSIVNASAFVASQLLHERRPDKPVIIKPNLVEPTSPPTTTDVRIIEGIVKALRETGMVDLDKEKTVTLPVQNHRVWNEISIPEILLNKFIISAPVLKEHSMCGVTISLKNMVGILPAKYYSGFWVYKKSMVHKYDTNGCIADIINIIHPDMAVVDATIGMRGSHLDGIGGGSQ